MNITHKENSDGSLNISFELSKEDIEYLKHDLNGIDGIVKWFSEGPSKNKIIQCKKRMMKEWIPILREEGKQIPASDEELCMMVISNEKYMNREQREALKNG